MTEANVPASSGSRVSGSRPSQISGNASTKSSSLRHVPPESYAERDTCFTVKGVEDQLIRSWANDPSVGGYLGSKIATQLVEDMVNNKQTISTRGSCHGDGIIHSIPTSELRQIVQNSMESNNMPDWMKGALASISAADSLLRHAARPVVGTVPNPKNRVVPARTLLTELSDEMSKSWPFENNIEGTYELTKDFVESLLAATHGLYLTGDKQEPMISVPPANFDLAIHDVCSRSGIPGFASDLAASATKIADHWMAESCRNRPPPPPFPSSFPSSLPPPPGVFGHKGSNGGDKSSLDNHSATDCGLSPPPRPIPPPPPMTPERQAAITAVDLALAPLRDYLTGLSMSADKSRLAQAKFQGDIDDLSQRVRSWESFSAWSHRATA